MTTSYIHGQNIPVVYQDNYTVQAAGDLTNVQVWIGMDYTQKVTISPQFLKKQGVNGGAVPETEGRVQYKRATVTFQDTGYFRSEVTPSHRDTYTKSFTPYQVGESEIGEPVMASGTQQFLVPGRNLETEISLINDTPFPSTFVSVAIDAEFTKKGRSL